MSNLQNPIFTDETKAREWLEARVWPNGPVCPHCGNADPAKIKALQGKAHRPGLYQCADCREQFTVTVKTVFERSKIPLTKWLAALFLLTASKKGVSAHQIHRSLDISYKSAWFMMHGLREAGRRGGSTHKNTVLTLVERGGSAPSFHVEGTTIAQIAPIIRKNISRESKLMTDEGNWYKELGKDFDCHDTVNHSVKEYVRQLRDAPAPLSRRVLFPRQQSRRAWH